MSGIYRHKWINVLSMYLCSLNIIIHLCLCNLDFPDGVFSQIEGLFHGDVEERHSHWFIVVPVRLALVLQIGMLN